MITKNGHQVVCHDCWGSRLSGNVRCDKLIPRQWGLSLRMLDDRYPDRAILRAAVQLVSIVELVTNLERLHF